MRKRSAAVTTEEEVAALTLSALDQQIATARWRAEENASRPPFAKLLSNGSSGLRSSGNGCMELLLPNEDFKTHAVVC